MQNQTYFLLLVATLVGFAAASPLAGDEGPILHRVRRNRPCTFGCSTTVVGNGLNVQDNPNGDRHRVVTNQGSWGSSSGYQPARGGQGGNQEARYPRGARHNQGSLDALEAGGALEEPTPAGGNRAQQGGQGKPNDVKISQPCLDCTVNVQGRGNTVRN